LFEILDLRRIRILRPADSRRQSATHSCYLTRHTCARRCRSIS
jgi:hypothetical protein